MLPSSLLRITSETEMWRTTSKLVAQLSPVLSAVVALDSHTYIDPVSNSNSFMYKYFVGGFGVDCCKGKQGPIHSTLVIFQGYLYIYAKQPRFNLIWNHNTRPFSLKWFIYYCPRLLVVIDGVKRECQTLKSLKSVSRFHKTESVCEQELVT